MRTGAIPFHPGTHSAFFISIRGEYCCMGQKFCTSCGAVLSEVMKFCENCGVAVEQGIPPLSPSPGSPASAVPVAPLPAAASPAPPGRSGKMPVKIIAGIFIVLILAAAAVFIVLPKISAGSSLLSSGPASGTGTITTPTTVPVTEVPTTVVPTPTPDPFPNALQLKDGFPFGEGKIASEGTVYRLWMNETYSWHNDMDNKYYLQKPKPGNKFLFVFINIFNKGDTRVWPPTSSNIVVHYNGQIYSADPTHYLPDKSSDRKATAIEVNEVQYFSKFFGSEYVEDFGYSHGMQLAYLYPGRSNAIDGYLVFEVPASFIPEKAYAEIVFNGKDVGVWKLA